MDIITWLLIIVAAYFLISRMMPAKGVTNITTEEAKGKFKDKGTQFVDVRTAGEYKANHRKPFKNIPLHELSNRIAELDKNKEVVVICQSGMRSMKAARILKKQGFNKISNVRGGIGAWS
ncbi:rhodanese-like domain-containing protein [Virgibacillus sediminis]|uniref:Rhodanese-like domain-containing protein n=1 Tax=Virgibacillus sediminis TaxID=202260 RepID=A0ABV7A5M8_9BACI